MVKFPEKNSFLKMVQNFLSFHSSNQEFARHFVKLCLLSRSALFYGFIVPSLGPPLGSSLYNFVCAAQTEADIFSYVALLLLQLRGVHGSSKTLEVFSPDKGAKESCWKRLYCSNIQLTENRE